MWYCSNVIPYDAPWYYQKPPNSIRDRFSDIVTMETAQFVQEHAPNIHFAACPYDNLSYALTHIGFDDGLFMEFGVFEGNTANHIAKTMQNKTIHCFDSLQGLPEDWTTKGSKGDYSTNGKIPRLESNAKLHIGWFNESLPIFSKDPEHQKPISFMHIDSDIYQSAKTILDHFEKQIVSGTVMVFDEFFNYPGYKDHEFRAFFEFINKTEMKYEFISCVDRGYSITVKML